MGELIAWVVYWVILSGAVGWAATQKGRGGVEWFLLACILSPIMAVLLLLACPAIENREEAPDKTIAAESPDGQDFYRPYRKAREGKSG